MTTENAIFEFFDGIPVQGPGSEKTTEQLLGLIPNNSDIVRALDIGCGTGRTSLVLAKSGIHVTATDIHQPFLDHLDSNAQKYKLVHRVKTLRMSMDSLSLPERSFDLIWSEASAYIMGFTKAINYWKKFLKKKGYMVVTELCWTSNSPAMEASQFWSLEYPRMSNIEEVKAGIISNGFEISEVITLPESDWNNYYNLLKNRIKQLENDNRPAIQDVINQINIEICIREQYSRDFDYFAFVLKLPDNTESP